MDGRRRGCFGTRKKNVEDIGLDDIGLPWHLYLVLMAAPKIVINWLISHNLLRSGYLCGPCNSPCRLVSAHTIDGSTIYTDNWLGYSSLNDDGYKKNLVCHKYRFRQVYINNKTKEEVIVNTNRIEGAWSHAKKHFLKINGTSVGNFESHLCEILFRNHNRNACTFVEILRAIQQVYTLQRPPTYTYEKPVFTSWRPDMNDSIIGSNGSYINEDESDVDRGISPDMESQDIPTVVSSSSSSSYRNQNQTSVETESPQPGTSHQKSPVHGRRRGWGGRPNVRGTNRQVARQSPNITDSPQAGPSSVESPPHRQTHSRKRTVNGEETNRKRKTRIPHFCPRDFNPKDDSEWEEETETPPTQVTRSRRGRLVKAPARKSFIRFDTDDSDFQ